MPSNPARPRLLPWLAASVLVLAVGIGAVVAAATADDPFGDAPVADDLIQRIGCTDSRPAETVEFYVREQRTCQLQGQTITVYTFHERGQRDDWLEAALSFAGGLYVVSDRWIVSPGNRELAEAVQQRIGGDIT